MWCVDLVRGGPADSCSRTMLSTHRQVATAWSKATSKSSSKQRVQHLSSPGSIEEASALPKYTLRLHTALETTAVPPPITAPPRSTSTYTTPALLQSRWPAQMVPQHCQTATASPPSESTMTPHPQHQPLPRPNHVSFAQSLHPKRK